MKASEIKKLPYTVFRVVNNEIWEGKVENLPTNDERFIEVYPLYSRSSYGKEYKKCNPELWNVDYIFKIETTLK